MSKPVEIPLSHSPQQALDWVQTKLPARPGEYRRDHDLFGDGTHFRVDFRDEIGRVVRSYFVVVNKGEIRSG